MRYRILRKPECERIISRVSGYLSLIQSLSVDEDSERESALWPILVTCSEKGKPLLPNLKDLMIVFKGEFQTSFNILPFILPPILETITTFQGEGHSTTMLSFYQLLSSHCSIQKVQHGGVTCPYLIPAFMLFKTIENLCIYEAEVAPFGGHTSPLSFPEFLHQLPSLKTLKASLTDFATMTTAAPPLNHPCLKTLTLSGTANAFQAFFTSNTICPLVDSCLLYFEDGDQPSWKEFFNGVVSVFPELSALCITEWGAHAHSPRVVLSDLQRLLQIPIREFQLLHVRAVLALEDLQIMAKAWPTLRVLSLPWNKICVAINIVLSEPWSSELHELTLPLDLTAFTSLHHDLSIIQKTKLRKLIICSPAKLPPKIGEMVRLAWNLLSFCPDLRDVRSYVGSDSKIWEEVNDLRETITSIREVVVACRN